MAKTKTEDTKQDPELVEPPRGFKAELIRTLIEANPDLGNNDLASMFAARMKDAGYKDDRDAAKVAQSFAQARSDMKRKKAGQQAEGEKEEEALPPGQEGEGELFASLRGLVRLVGKEQAKRVVLGIIDSIGR